MQGRALKLLVFPFALLAVDSAAWADVLQFAPDRDATLYEDVGGGVANGSGSHVFMGRTGPDADSSSRRALLRFDVSAIPADAVIDSAELSFGINQVPSVLPTGGTVSVHRVVADWGEGGSNAPGPEGGGTAAQSQDATWQHRFYDTEFWTEPGGDFLLTASSASGYGADIETITLPSTEAMTRDIRKWVKYPDENFGWMMIGNETQDYTARRIDSRDQGGGAPPELTVEFHMAGVTDNLGLELLTSGLDSPVVITNAGDGSDRLFIVEQEGIIRIFDLSSGTLLPTPFLDITAEVDDVGSEQGLLGLAFHPDFENNRQFYVNYTYDPGPGLDRTRIAMYQASVGNPNIANTTETVILEFEQDFANHNGGDIHFDPDGYLVIATGDGGSGNDPNNRAQTLTTLLGKMLRIDIDSSRAKDDVSEGGTGLCGLVQNYAIPAGNPYVGGDSGCDEILHIGMRNPWRFSFDALTGDMFIGDVGQGLWEEISFAPAGATDINFGWKICEGAHVRGSSTNLCTFGELPIIEYARSGGNCAVTGGYVYRGPIASLQGRYVYADYCSARIWIAEFDGANWVSEEWMETPSLGAIPTFGQDEQCNLYVADFGTNSIYRFVNTELFFESGFENGAFAGDPLSCQ